MPHFSLVAVTTQRVLDSSLEIDFQNSSSTQLADLLGRLADGQVACSSLTMLDFTSGGQSATLFSCLVCFELIHRRFLFFMRLFRAEYKIPVPIESQSVTTRRRPSKAEFDRRSKVFYLAAPSTSGYHANVTGCSA